MAACPALRPLYHRKPTSGQAGQNICYGSKADLVGLPGRSLVCCKKRTSAIDAAMSAQGHNRN